MDVGLGVLELTVGVWLTGPTDATDGTELLTAGLAEELGAEESTTGVLPLDVHAASRQALRINALAPYAVPVGMRAI